MFCRVLQQNQHPTQMGIIKVNTNYTVSKKKGWSTILATTSTNVGRFSKCLYSLIQIWICNKLIIHCPPYLKPVAAIPCVTKECQFCHCTSTTNSSACDFNTTTRQIYLFKLLVIMAIIFPVYKTKLQNIDKVKQQLIHMWNNLAQSVIDDAITLLTNHGVCDFVPVSMRRGTFWTLGLSVCVIVFGETENRYSVWW